MNVVKKTLVAGFFLFLAGSFLAVFLASHISEKNEKYFNSFQHSFSGTIYKYKEDRSSHKADIYINIEQSDLNYYDPRDSLESYFVIIKDKKAKINTTIQDAAEQAAKTRIKEGDMLKYDGKKNLVFWYRDGIMLGRWRPRLNFLRSYNDVKW